MSGNRESLEELRKIRELLTPKPEPKPEPPKNLFEEFKDFLKQYRVMGLAVAFIMALYLGRLVQALVFAFISPILTQIFLLIGFVTWDVVLADPASYPLMINPVVFISELITFLIVAFVIFILVKITARLGIE